MLENCFISGGKTGVEWANVESAQIHPKPSAKISGGVESRRLLQSKRRATNAKQLGEAKLHEPAANATASAAAATSSKKYR